MYARQQAVAIGKRRRTMKQLSLPLKKLETSDIEMPRLRRDDKEKAAIAKKERMKREMMYLSTTQLSGNGKNRNPNEKR